MRDEAAQPPKAMSAAGSGARVSAQSRAGTRAGSDGATTPSSQPTPDLKAARQRRRLRWFTVWAPAAFVSLLIIVLILQHRHETLAVHVAILGLVVSGALAFSHFVFTRIQAQEAEIFRQNRYLTSMHATGRLLSESRDLHHALAQVLTGVLEAIGVEAGEILLIEEASGDLVLSVQRGSYPEAFREVSRFKWGQGIPGLVAQASEPIVVHDLAREPRFLRRALTQVGFRAFASVPLKSGDEVVGVMSVAARDAARLGDAEVRLLADLGNQIGLAVGNARYVEKLPALAALEERQRIARELHDSLAQTLGSLQMGLAAIRERLRRVPPPEAAKELKRLEGVARTAYAEVRQEIFGLRTMVSRELDLVPALTEYLTEINRQTGLQIDLRVLDQRATRLPLGFEVELIRIIQEALANVVKHARATRAQVTFDVEGGAARITVRDDGAGFDPEERRGRQAFGLETMRERAETVGGTFAITSARGSGTLVEVRLPLTGLEDRSHES